MDLSPLWLSLQLAACTTAILFLIGLPIAAGLVFYSWRGKFLVEAIVSLPLVLPPTVLGFYLLWMMSPNSVLGQWLFATTGLRLPFTFAGILVGSVIANLPFAVRPFSAALAAVDRRLIEASYCLGVSRWQTFLRVTLPLAWPGVATGMLLTFAHTIGEFGVVLMIGGNRPEVTRTISIAIYDDVQKLDYASASQSAAILLAFSFIVLCVAHAWTRKGWPA